ncbi:hypothetical protein CcaverHIS641_0200300 [Cutaneotrichosporon cavernicola]|nr:hypothetical protein CcaverHIS641_0200300 [Cutaneotrichosporon cavernicola]
MQRILLVLHDLLPPPPLEAWLGNPVATDSTSVSLAPDLLPKIPTSSFGNGPKLSSQMYSFDYPAPLSNSSPAASTAAEAIPAVINKLYEQETTPYGRSKAFSKILPPHSSPTPLASSSTAANNRGLSLPHLSTPRSPAPSSGPSPSTAASKRKFCDLFDDDTPIKSLKRPAISVPPTRFSLALPPITSAARRHDTSQVGSSSAKRKRHRLDDGMPSKSPKRPAVSASPLAFHLALPPTGPVRNHQGASSQMPLFGCVGSREKGYQYCLTCHNRGIDCEFHTRYKARGSEEPAAKENGIAHKGKGKTAEYRLKSEERKQTANELSQAASGSQMEGHHSIPADGEGPVLECTSIGPQDKEPTDVIDLTLLEDTDDDEGDDLEEGPIGDHIARDPPGPAPAVHQPNEEEDEERGDDEESEDELEEVPIY